MAFSYSKKVTGGVHATVWQFGRILSLDGRARVLSFEVDGWVSQELKDQGEDPITRERIVLTDDAYPLNPSNPAEAALIARFEQIAEAHLGVTP